MKGRRFWIVGGLVLVLLAFAISAGATGAENNVCKIGSTGYATLASAVTAAQNGSTIELLQSFAIDATQAINEKTFTLDFKGFTITSNVVGGNPAFNIIKSSVTLQDTASMMPGGIVGGTQSANYLLRVSDANSTLSVKRCTIGDSKSECSCIRSVGTVNIEDGAVLKGMYNVVNYGGANLSITGGSFDSEYMCVSTNGNTNAKAKSVSITGGTFTSGDTAIYLPSAVTAPNGISISGANITGGLIGVAVRAGKVSIENTNITCTAVRKHNGSLEGGKSDSLTGAVVLGKPSGSDEDEYCGDIDLTIGAGCTIENTATGDNDAIVFDKQYCKNYDNPNLYSASFTLDPTSNVTGNIVEVTGSNTANPRTFTPMVARIGSKWYSTLDAAITAASGSAVITLLTDDQVLSVANVTALKAKTGVCVSYAGVDYYGANADGNYINNGVDGYVFANGEKVNIVQYSEAATETGVAFKIGESGSEKTFSVANKKLDVYGGGKGASTLNSSDLTLTNGTVRMLFAGGWGANKGENKVTTANVTVKGGVAARVHGGGQMYSVVDTGNVTVSGGTVGFVFGGGVNAGSIGGSAERAKTDPVTQVKNATVTVSGSPILKGGTYGVLYGGGQGFATVNTATVNITGITGTPNMSETYVAAGGANGYTGQSTVTLGAGIKVKSVQSINRGIMDSAEMIVNGTVTNLYVGGEDPETFTNDIVNGGFTGTAKDTLKVTIGKGAAITNLYAGSNYCNYLPVTAPWVTLTNNGTVSGHNDYTCPAYRVKTMSSDGITNTATYYQTVNAAAAATGADITSTVYVVKDSTIAATIPVTSDLTFEGANIGTESVPKYPYIDGGYTTSTAGVPIFTVTGTSATFKNLTLQNGNGGFSSGAIKFTGSGTLTVQNCAFTGNHGENGGAVSASGGQFNITNCVFSDNNGTNGGAIYANNLSAQSTIAASAFIGNTATGSGKHIYCNDSSIDISKNFWNTGEIPKIDDVANADVCGTVETGKVAISDYYTTRDAATGALGGLTPYDPTKAVNYYFVTVDSAVTGYRTIEAALEYAAKITAPSSAITIEFFKDIDKEIMIGTSLMLKGGDNAVPFKVKGIVTDKALTLQNLTVTGSITGSGTIGANGTVTVGGDVANPISVQGVSDKLIVGGAATKSTVSMGNVYHPFTVTVPTGIQSISASPRYEEKYVKHGETVTITAVPAGNYAFKAWTFSPDVIPSGASATALTTSFTATRGYALSAKASKLAERITIDTGYDTDINVPLYVGETFTPVSVTVDGEPENGAVTWTCDAPTVATVDPITGIVTAQGVVAGTGGGIGLATVTATAADESELTASYTVRVRPRVDLTDDIQLYIDNVSSGQATVVPAVVPAGSVAYELVVSDTDIATEQDKLVTALEIGSTTLQAQDLDGKVLDEVNVTVSERDPAQMKDATIALTYGDQANLLDTDYMGIVAGTDNIRYEVGGTAASAITVNKAGRVSVVATSGNLSATVTAKAYNGDAATDIYKTATITIGPKDTLPANVSFKQPLYTVAVGASQSFADQLVGPDASKYTTVSCEFIPEDGARINDDQVTVTSIVVGAYKVTAKVTLEKGGVTRPYETSTIVRFEKRTPTNIAIDQMKGNNSAKASLMVGESMALSASAIAVVSTQMASPEIYTRDQVDQRVTWSSTIQNKLIVDESSGVVTAVGSVKSTVTSPPINITVESEADPNVSMNFGFNLYDRATKLAFDGGAAKTYAVDTSVVQRASLTPEGTAPAPITYTSSDTNVAEPVAAANNDLAGFKVKGVGTATVTAEVRTDGGTVLTATQLVTGVKKIQSVVPEPSPDPVAIGETKQLVVASYSPGDCNPVITYTSSDPTIVSITQEGYYTLLRPYTGTITLTVKAQTADGTSASDVRTIYFKQPELQRISLPAAITLSHGQSVTLEPVVYPVGATVGSIAWTSSDSNVATVTNDGVVKGLTNGTAKITATSNSIYAECTVTVKENVAPPSSVEMRDPVTDTVSTAAFRAKALAVPTAKLNVNVGEPKTFTAEVVFPSADASRTAASVANGLSLSGGETLITAMKGNVTTTDNKTYTVPITITGNDIGTADISLYYKEGCVVAQYRVNVRNPYTDIALTGLSDAMLVGQTAKPGVSFTLLDATKGATDASVELVSDEPIAASGALSYDAATGLVTAVKAGTGTVTVKGKIKTPDNPNPVDEVEDTVTITVSAPAVQSVSLPSTDIALACGAELDIKPTVLPVQSGAVATAVSDKPGVVKAVTVNGVTTLTAQSHGEATITFSAGDKTAAMDVTVLPKSAESGMKVADSITWYGGYQLPAGSSTLPKARFDSADHDVATVDNLGNIKAVGEGTTEITASYAGVRSVNTVTVTENAIAPESIALDKTSMSLTVNATGQLTATVLPINTTNRMVTWTSSDGAVATVDQDGLVTAVAKGSAIITATTQLGGKTATCAVTVTSNTPGPGTIAVTGVALSPKTLTVAVNGTASLTATIAPADATNKALTFASDKPAIATVSAAGVVTGVAEGEAVITVTTQDGGFTDTAKVTVTKDPRDRSIALDKEELELVVNDTAQLVATTNPAGQKVLWSSSAMNIVSVDQEGTVKAIAKGEAIITASIPTGSASCRVTVVEESPVKLEYDVLAMLKNKKLTLKAPKGCTVKWSSSDPSIATIGKKGKISTKKKLGTAVITGTVTAVTDKADPAIKVGDVGRLTLNVRKKGQLVTKVKADVKKVYLLMGDALTLHPTLVPANVPDPQIRYTSSNPAVATVGKTGKITAVSLGEAKITVLSTSSKKKVVNVVVTDGTVKIGVKPEKKTLKIGQKLQLSVTTKPAGGAVTFTCKDASVASVDANGLVTALAKGETKIVVTAPSGVKASVAITVKQP